MKRFAGAVLVLAVASFCSGLLGRSVTQAFAQGDPRFGLPVPIEQQAKQAVLMHRIGQNQCDKLQFVQGHIVGFSCNQDECYVLTSGTQQ